MDFKELDRTIKKLVADDEIAEAITLLSTYFKDHPVVHDIILQSGRYNSLRKEQIKGTVDFDTIQTYLNQLRANILIFVQNQKSTNGLETPTNIKENKDIETDFKASVARISVLWLLYDIKHRVDGLTITDICRLTQSKSRKFIVEALKESEVAEIVKKEKKGKNAYWSITEKGIQLAEKFKETALWEGYLVD